jgi:hypothetical protein
LLASSGILLSEPSGDLRGRAADEPAKAPAPADETWVGPMARVHSRFTGRPGTFALFGDSITVSLALWAPLRHARKNKNMSQEAVAAFQRVNEYMKPECWDKWRGPRYGNEGSMTIRWAHQHIDEWLKQLNPETALLMFGQGYDVPTLIARDGVHPSNPKLFQGDYSTDGLSKNGYALRSYLTLMAYDEVIRKVLRPAK